MKFLYLSLVDSDGRQWPYSCLHSCVVVALTFSHAIHKFDPMRYSRY